MKASRKSFSTIIFWSVLFFVSQLSIMSMAGERHNHRVGMLTGAGGHHAEGSVNIEGHKLVLSNIDVDQVPDGRVYLANDAKYDSGVELGRLTQFSGTVNYTIPDRVNPDDFNSVLIWCKKFSVEIGHANLTPASK